MRAADPAKLSLNTATVKKQWGIAQAIEGCARHGIRGIAPWRDWWRRDPDEVMRTCKERHQRT